MQGVLNTTFVYDFWKIYQGWLTGFKSKKTRHFLIKIPPFHAIFSITKYKPSNNKKRPNLKFVMPYNVPFSKWLSLKLNSMQRKKNIIEYCLLFKYITDWKNRNLIFFRESKQFYPIIFRCYHGICVFMGMKMTIYMNEKYDL